MNALLLSGTLSGVVLWLLSAVAAGVAAFYRRAEYAYVGKVHRLLRVERIGRSKARDEYQAERESSRRALVEPPERFRQTPLEQAAQVDVAARERRGGSTDLAERTRVAFAAREQARQHREEIVANAPTEAEREYGFALERAHVQRDEAYRRFVEASDAAARQLVAGLASLVPPNRLARIHEEVLAACRACLTATEAYNEAVAHENADEAVNAAEDVIATQAAFWEVLRQLDSIASL